MKVKLTKRTVKITLSHEEATDIVHDIEAGHIGSGGYFFGDVQDLSDLQDRLQDELGIDL